MCYLYSYYLMYYNILLILVGNKIILLKKILKNLS